MRPLVQEIARQVAAEVLARVNQERPQSDAGGAKPATPGTPAGGVAPVLLRLDEAARFLAMSPRKLKYLTSRGLIPAVRNGRWVRYHVVDLTAWLEAAKQ
jgi:excisionase family DNA binding protein